MILRVAYRVNGTLQEVSHTFTVGLREEEKPPSAPEKAQPVPTPPPSTVVSREPKGTGKNLVVLVHGCCTDANDVSNIWDNFGTHIAGTITIQTAGTWEVVVLDWTQDTPPITDANIGDWQKPFHTAYLNALKRDHDLATAILKVKNRYKYVHLIGHSAGSNLINVAANELIIDWLKLQNKEERPFIHLTFLDAYTPNNDDYGFWGGNYPHYSEHYVDLWSNKSSISPWTNTILRNAFNFNITSLNSEDPLKEKKFWGHHWPIYWYQKSVTSTSPKFKYGYPLSREGGNNRFDSLAGNYRPGKQCNLTKVGDPCVQK